MKLTAGAPFIAALAGQIGVCFVAAHLGPLAISDDDYARVVIAQQFSSHPGPDPSGTSWLPLPFFWTGLPMMAFGATLDVARGVAVAMALVSIALLYQAARWLGAPPLGAGLAALLAAALPNAARLSVATVPEYPTAALLVVAMVGMTLPRREEPRTWTELLRLPQVGAALAVALATACRYEAWPVACGMSFLFLARWVVERRRLLPRTGATPDPRESSTPERLPLRLPATLWCAGSSSGFILLWLLHGVFRKGDMFFFVQRVTHYKRALGVADPASWQDAWRSYPEALLGHEPAACALLLLGAAGLGFSRFKRKGPTRLARAESTLTTCPLASHLPLIVLPLLLLGVLTVGGMRGGAPTHHAERALLSLWLLSALLGVVWLARVWAGARWPERAAWLLLVPVGLGLAGPRATPPDGFAERQAEESLGRGLRRYAQSERVVLATTDYGYLAVQAAAGAPERFSVLDHHDPREDAPTGQPEQRTLSLAAARQARLIVAPRAWTLAGFEPALRAGGLALFTRAGSGKLIRDE